MSEGYKPKVTNECPHPKCNVQKPRHLYACRTHWFQLPKKLRDKIYSSYNLSQWEEWSKNDKAAIEYWGKDEVRSDKAVRQLSF